MVIRTARLVLRDMGEADLPGLASMLEDPVAMTHYEGPFSDGEVRGWLDRQRRRYAEDGYGLWAVVGRESGELLGQCGITWQDIGGEWRPEIGYHVKRAWWGYGYATEAALACRDYAFDELGMGEVWAQVRDSNIASMNVAIRVGMTVRYRFVKMYRGVEMPHYAFSVRR
ncbi:MAG: GNAT family N-acetyltransferase [Propionibacteriaceae bacterium]|jgi:RimJ/RimL family protein N-acetyltransferase|nr:GNAT family N-acetyltransferase [Propionibacteriaceae bacterium]